MSRLLPLFLFLFIGVFQVQAKETEKNFVLKNSNTADTLYTGTIKVHASISSFPLPNAQVIFTLEDTVNQISNLVFEGLTNANGDLMIDKLPIFNAFVGFEEFGIHPTKNIIISNNGTASDHHIQLKLNLRSAVHGYIIDIQGRVVEEIYMTYNPFTNSHEGSWRASHQKSGTYIFYVQTSTQRRASKINHLANQPGFISNSKPINPYTKSLKTSATESYKYKIEIRSEVSEPYVQFVYLSEYETKDFSFPIIHLPIADARIKGTVSINRSVLAPNAKMSWSNLFSDDEFIIYTDENGHYSKDDVVVPLDENFTNPEFTRYYLTVNIGDSITFKVDPVLLYSGELKEQNHNINLL